MSEVLIYIHGFLSSPASEKALLLKRVSEARGMRFYCPDMNLAPTQAVENVRAILRRHKDDTVYLVGSSLGGFYVTSLLGEFACRAVLINPAVAPWRVVQNFLGEQTVYGTGQRVEIKAHYGKELEVLAEKTMKEPKNVLVVLATGDEVLDWREGRAFYKDCHQWVLDGEDHRLSNILKYADTILNFLQEKES